MARKATRKVSAKSTRRARRESPHGRAPRTYYAMTADEKTLIRFASHPQRLAAMRAEKLKPIGALDYRNRIIEDYDGKLKLIDRRGEAPKQDAPAPQVASGGNAGGFDVQALVAALTPALAQALGQVRGTPGEQPQATRQASSH